MPTRCRPHWTIAQRIAHLSRRDPLSGCWLWQAATMPNGYGVVNWRDKLWLAHRLSWIGAHDRPIPTGGMICHRCDERRCVNPEHLFLGTRQVNMDDLKAKRLRRSTAADSGRLHIFIRGLELAGTVTWITPHKENDHEQTNRQATRAKGNQGGGQNPDAAPAPGPASALNRGRSRSRSHVRDSAPDGG